MCVCVGGVVFALRVKSVLKSKVVAFIGLNDIYVWGRGRSVCMCVYVYVRARGSVCSLS